MRMKIHYILLILIVGLGLSGPAGATEVVDRIVAIVDADIVTQVELEREAGPYLKQIEASQAGALEKKRARLKILNQILTRLIEVSLTQQEAKKYRLAVSDQDIDAAIVNVRTNKGLSEEDFIEALQLNNMTLEEYRKEIEGQILRARLINHAVKSKVVVSKASIEAYYNEHKSQYEGIKKYSIGHIVMRNKTRMQEVKAKLDQGENFKILARDYSEAPNAKQGGRLGSFDITSFPDVIRNAIVNLEPGQYTDVIDTARGYQIFYVDDVIAEGAKTFEQAYDEIHGILYKNQVEKKFDDWMKSLKEKAHIKIMLEQAPSAE